MAQKHGDIDYRSYYERIMRMNEGSELHKMIREKLSHEREDYCGEVGLTLNKEINGIEYCIRGRADGVAVTSNGGIMIDEYKTAGYEVKYASEFHEAQLKCYAYIMCLERGLSNIHGRLIYCRTAPISEQDLSLKYYEYELSLDMLERFFVALIAKISKYVEYSDMRRKIVLPSAKDVPFPYAELREGQTELISTAYKCMKKGERLFVQAPTGTGKTISTLYPAVRALGNGICDKIFYLTAKSSTRREAYNASLRLCGAGAKLRTIVLSPKNVMCLNGCVSGNNGSLHNCDTTVCPYAKGYNNRVQFAIDELLFAQNHYIRDDIKKAAQKYKICPYELSLDISELCDIIICDYNYVFDPVVYLRRYFSDNPIINGSFVFLADEAHNLPERARDMYSARLSCKRFEKLYSSLPSNEKQLISYLAEFITSMRKLRGLCKNEIFKDEKQNECAFRLDKELYMPFIGSVECLCGRLDKWLKMNKGDFSERAIADLCFDLHKFLKISEIYDEAFLNYIEIFGGDISFKIFCLDPSHPIGSRLNKAVSSVLFSATLTPPDYFADVLGRSGKYRTLSLPSPFPRNNLCVTAVTSVSTRFEDRKKSVKKIASCIAHTVTHKIGNYIVYFPSYAYLEDVLTVFSSKFPNVPLIVQKPGMNAAERKHFIDSFPEDTGKMRVGFCVLGGSFSEGIDLPGTRLIGTVIVGVGLPGLSNEKNIVRDYFESKFGRGYDYAYTYPGMNNVLQAAGRVIRRDTDKGVIVLIDDRYATPVYRELFPEHWSNIKYVDSTDNLSKNIESFWKDQ